MATAHNTPFIDTHCHLEMKEFDSDRAEVIARAHASGIEAMITVGSDLKGTLGALELAEQNDLIFAAIGIHPHDAQHFTDDIYRQLKEWSARTKVVAIGETGLDYHYDHSPRDIQAVVFKRHLELARQTNLPVIVHSRSAAEDTLAILRESGNSQGVMHCFSGDRKMAAEVISLGFHISLAGPVTFNRAAELKEIAGLIPDENLLLETDAPYLSPEPLRGKRNEPSHLLHTARLIASLRGVSLEDISRITTLNARRLFRIGTVPEQAEVAYRIRDSLYLNITNRCTNACTFCVKFHTDYVKGHNLRLDREPTESEIRDAIGNPSLYREIVFCGYGEPLSRLEVVKNVAAWIKERQGRVRINTNGQANLIHGRKVVRELQGLVDSISVSLDAQDEETYNRICRPVFPNAFKEVLAFIKEAKEAIPEVRATVVDLEGVDIEKCRSIAESLGADFTVRKLDVVG